MYGSTEPPGKGLNTWTESEGSRMIPEDSRDGSPHVHPPKNASVRKGSGQYGPTAGMIWSRLLSAGCFWITLIISRYHGQKLGTKMTQMALLAGADDLAGTMYLDDVTGEAGGSTGNI